jgi:hypothetical protein
MIVSLEKADANVSNYNTFWPCNKSMTPILPGQKVRKMLPQRRKIGKDSDR